MGALISVLFLMFTSYVVAQTGQDNALCGFIAATNIQSIFGYSTWTCYVNGTTAFNPCNGWSGVTCNGNSVDTINLDYVGLSGKNLHYLLLFSSFWASVVCLECFLTSGSKY